jgi:hypothetical protein
MHFRMNARQLLCIAAISGIGVLAILASSQAGEDSSPASVLLESVPTCWTIPASASFMEIIHVRVRLNRDGSLAGEPTVLAASENKPTREVEQSAVNAIKKCAPFRGLSKFADTYEDWREVTINFDLRDISQH